ncbi:hypothetical protein [Asaia prunellae]|uniref:hypothetical protein n=1 Tax=Asaia prunellae TaxID=610245 RepID=UPI00047052E9|nr:hypothetical protein [Asaia prunellae]
MALKQTELTLTDGGVDKRFIITRMTAMQADRWARHLVTALTRAGVQLPSEAMEMGMAGLGGIAQALYGQLDDEAADVAIAELRKTVKIARDPSNPAATSGLTEFDIVDAEALGKLDQEAFRLHVDFIRAAARFISPLVGMLVPVASPDPSPAA